eukprot:gnl/MRDRNA2_/MRDRNA2_110582_c0_seq1.p1 gnl/MRDRNA2_/MRDRNA2_110582_c0~~gnl/MRDRNA2_/MRDRNA2_110582_c0_seq1.p1  ORF type:complete len:1183 (-),score=255.04 gnl/MRDRNA2_/MRDRNA2_110582_c0_seq1:27-3515(-)
MAVPTEDQCQESQQRLQLSTAQWFLLLAIFPCIVVTGIAYFMFKEKKVPHVEPAATKHENEAAPPAFKGIRHRHQSQTRKSHDGHKHLAIPSPNIQEPSEQKASATVTETKLLTAKAKSDRRTYQYAKLSNGLQIVNVRDPSATTIGVAVSVQAGSLNNPKDVLGLAHFCEHMVFLGTKNFPDPSSFDRFINKYGGGNNAYTSDQDTVYYMSTLRQGWNESLARMSDFFRAPLFDRAYVEKEVHAIESEHAKNVQNPTQRTYEVMQSLADSRSPVSWFSTGDLETLINEPRKKGLDTVEELKKFFKENYCPGKFGVVTYSSDALDSQLEDSLAQFGNIPEGTCSTASASQPVVDAWHPKDAPAHVGKWVHIQAAQARSQLQVMWPMDSIQKLYKSSPADYVSHVLTWPGKQSLIRALKDDAGLVTKARFDEDTTSLGTTLSFTVDLTHKGREHPSAILELLYAFLAQVKEHGVDMDVYRSIAAAAQVTFDWKDKPATAEAVTDVADSLTWLPKDDLLTAGYTIPDPDSDLARKVLEKMTPDNMNVAFVDTQFKPYDPAKLKTLPHYGVPHTIRPFEEVVEGRVSQWLKWLDEKKAKQRSQNLESILKNHGIDVPQEMQQAKPIQNIPKDITLAHAKAQVGDDIETKLFGVRPKDVPQSVGGSLWYRQGTMDESPKVLAQFLLRKKADQGDGMTAKDALLLNVYMRLKQLLLEPETADFKETGSSYSIELGEELSMSFKGFAESLPKFVHTVFDEMGKDMDLSSELGQKQYAYIVEQLGDELQLYAEMPVSYAVQDRNSILQKGMKSRNEYIAAVSELKAEEVPGTLKRTLLNKQLHYSSLMLGNIDQKDAEALHKKCADDIHQGHGELTLSVDEIELQPPVVNFRRPLEIRKPNPKPGDLNHVTVVSLLMGIPDVQDRVIFSILGDIFSQLAYQELRTERGLGYVVNAGQIMISNVMGMSCVVQGTRKRPDEVEPLIEWVFNVKMRSFLQDMSPDDFLQYKNSFILQLKSPPENLQEELVHWPSQVFQGGKCFGLRDKMILYAMDKLSSKQQLIDAWDGMLAPKKETGLRQKITVKYFGQPSPDARPSSQEFVEALKKAEVDDATADQARKEHDSAMILEDADSVSRAKVVQDTEKTVSKDNVYFPGNLGCEEIAATGFLQY